LNFYIFRKTTRTDKILFLKKVELNFGGFFGLKFNSIKPQNLTKGGFLHFPINFAFFHTILQKVCQFYRQQIQIFYSQNREINFHQNNLFQVNLVLNFITIN
jgi:hypothetical protein